ncbi:uncharacterized protein cracdla isoform X1 [Misgurnus anguillicaudatus]|uniref:uncharacterized protein cracdla isoform X1 n=2 Tax=Misgurnus anguillicaudatus TaxID=75329 RepID=UPI003CCFAF95
MDILEPSRDPEGGGSDALTGERQSRLKSLKSRLFGKIRRKDGDGGVKSQSESDIMLGVEDSEHDFCSQSMLGSRTLSHDSVFLAENTHSDPEPQRGLSHENIHGNIQALQMKLQQQKMHLGPPPLLLSSKRHTDLGGSAEDDDLPRLSRSISNKPHVSFQPLFPQPISTAFLPISPSNSSSGVDFSTPPQFTSLLDNSAARHRMSIKPKNQRAGGKNKRTVTSAESRPRSESLNNLERSLTKREEKPVAKEMACVRSYSSKVLRLGERQTALQSKSTPPVLSFLSLKDNEETSQVSGEKEHKNLLFTSSQNSCLKKLTPAEVPVSTIRQEVAKETKSLTRSDESQVAKPQSPVVSINRTIKQDLNDSKLLKNSQSNPVSTLRAHVDTIQEPSIMQDEKSVQTVVNVEIQHSSPQAPVNVITRVNLRPSSLRRNAYSADEKCESKILQSVTTVLPSAQEQHSQTESMKRPRSISATLQLTPSSDKIQELPRTASFTGVVEQGGLKKDPTYPSKPSLTFKTQGQLSSQSEKTKKDPHCSMPPQSQKEEKAQVIPPKFIDLATYSSQTQDVEESKDNGMQELGVEATEEEVQEGVEEAEEAGEDVTNVREANEREATNSFGVKLRSSSLSLKFRLDKTQSEIKVKQHSAEVSTLSPPLALRSDSTSQVEPKDHRSSMGSKLKNPLLEANESSNPSCTPKSVSKDKETIGFPRQAEPTQPSLLPSKATKIAPLVPKEGTDLLPKEPIAVTSQENAPTSTASEMSWMEMAREKTRSLQQLFTSRLPDFPSFQTTTRPTTLNTTQPLPQTSTSQASARATQNITNQQTATNLSLRPTEMPTRHLPSVKSSGRSTQPVQTHISTTTQPLALPTCTIQTTTSQSQVDCIKELQFQSKPQICSSTTKTTQSTVTCTSTIQSTTHTTHTAKQLSSQPKSPPIQQSLPPHAGPLQTSQTSTQSLLRPTPSPASPYLSSSSKKTSHLMSQQSVKTVLKDHPQNEGFECETPPIQQSLPLHAGPLQTSQTSTQSSLHPKLSPAYQYLSSSPKKTSHLMPQQFVKTFSKDQPQNEGFEPKIPPIQQSSPPRQTGSLQTSQTSTQALLHSKLSPAYQYLSSSPKTTYHLLPQQSDKTVSKDQPQNEGFEPKMPPIQQSSPPLQAGPLQTPQTSTQALLHSKPSPAYPYLSSSPPKTSQMRSQQSTNTVPKDQPQNEGFEPSITSGKADRVSTPQGKGNRLEDIKPLWATGMGNKTQLVQHLENQSTAATKAGEQKDITESQATAQSTATVSKVSTTDTGTDPKACVAMRTGDREDKWQKKLVPPSSSPSSSSPLQSVQDSDQPSWMELAKRKSLAWSDKTMD